LQARRPLPVLAPTLIQDFEGHLQRVELAPATIRNYSADVRGFVRFLLSDQNIARNGKSNGRAHTSEQPGDYSLTIPSENDFTRYRDHLIQATNQSPATVNRRLQALRLFGRFLHEQGFAETNPAQHLPLIANGHDDVAPRVLDDDEIEQLIVAVRAGARRRLMRRDYAIIELMLQAGLRVNEVALLTKDDIVATANGMRLVVRGITEHHVRQVPLNETLARALREYLQFRPALPNVNTLFVSQQGKPLSTRSIQRLVEEYAEAAELADVSAYSLRHTCAKKLLNENSPEAVAKWLGHKSVESLNKYR
jgi:site-specific recombinase XerD